MSVSFQLPRDLFFQYFIYMLVKGVDCIGQICLNEDSRMFSSEFFPHGNHYVLALSHVIPDKMVASSLPNKDEKCVCSGNYLG